MLALFKASHRVRKISRSFIHHWAGVNIDEIAARKIKYEKLRRQGIEVARTILSVLYLPPFTFLKTYLRNRRTGNLENICVLRLPCTKPVCCCEMTLRGMERGGGGGKGTGKRRRGRSVLPSPSPPPSFTPPPLKNTCTASSSRTGVKKPPERTDVKKTKLVTIVVTTIRRRLTEN